MKILKFLFSLVITVGLAFICDNQFKPSDSDTAIPPLGKLFNPFTGFWQNAKSSTDLPTESINLNQLIAPVEVQFDEKMVPHVFAQNMQDAMFIQGYLTAQDRLWQMDSGARFGSGRLSEILGEGALEGDMIQRRRGIFWLPKEQLKNGKKKKKHTTYGNLSQEE
jgi:penicillin amidase